MTHAPSSLLPAGAPRALSDDEFEALVDACAWRRHGCLLLDTRPDARPGPAAQHVRGSASVPFDDPEDPPAMLLPRRGRPLVVVAESEVARARAEGLTRRGWPTWWYDAPPPTQLLAPGSPPGAAWDVDPYLRAQHPVLDPTAEAPVLDLGCGSSREGVYLAQHGHRVVGLDRLPDALELARRRAAHHGVVLETLERRVRRGADLPPGPFSAVLLFRFAQRGLVSALAERMAPGGIVVVRAYGWQEPRAGAAQPRAAPPGAGPRRVRFRYSPEVLADELGPGWERIDGPRLVYEDGAAWALATARWRGR